jgi:hypothetical protein
MPPRAVLGGATTKAKGISTAKNGFAVKGGAEDESKKSLQRTREKLLKEVESREMQREETERRVEEARADRLAVQSLP